jgi:hypothetical protein
MSAGEEDGIVKPFPDDYTILLFCYSAGRHTDGFTSDSTAEIHRSSMRKIKRA